MMNLFFFYALALNVSFADKIIDGFNAVISFIGRIFQGLFNLIADSFNALLDFLEKPLSLLYYLLENIFYAFFKFAEILIMIIKIFVAFFQFVGALISGITRTTKAWANISVSPDTNFPSASHQGFYTIIELLQPTGILTVVPLVATGFLWLYFIIKMIGLFGGTISVAPFGRSSD